MPITGIENGAPQRPTCSGGPVSAAAARTLDPAAAGTGAKLPARSARRMRACSAAWRAPAQTRSNARSCLSLIPETRSSPLEWSARAGPANIARPTSTQPRAAGADTNACTRPPQARAKTIGLTARPPAVFRLKPGADLATPRPGTIHYIQGNPAGRITQSELPPTSTSARLHCRRCLLAKQPAAYGLWLFGRSGILLAARRQRSFRRLPARVLTPIVRHLARARTTLTQWVLRRPVFLPHFRAISCLR